MGGQDGVMNSAPFIQMFWVLVSFISFGLLIFFLAQWECRKAEKNLAALAERLDFAFVSGGQRLIRATFSRATGELRGKLVEVFNYVTYNGKNSERWSAVSARLPHARGLTFTLGVRSFLTKIGEMFGQLALTTRDAGFDAEWVARSNRPEFFSAALLPELRAKLMAAHAAGSHGRFTLADGLVTYAESGSFADAKRCERFPALVDIVCDLADIAEVAPDGDGAAPRS